MILQGSQRGGARNLALHLLKDENDHVEIHELRGFVSDDLVCALNEAHAISKGTKAKQFLFSVSFNPPAQENVSTTDFEAAINRVEKHFGLTDQPRAIVFHEKEGRRHAHAVWSRIDAENMKAIPLPFTKRDLTTISRNLFIEHGWKLPPGYVNSAERDPTNYTMAQWQHAKRMGKDPRDIKTAIQEAWSISDGKAAFRHALKERGYYLARGDRRGFVMLDYRGEIYSATKWLGLKSKALKQKLGDEKDLPSVQETKEILAKKMVSHLEALKQAQAEKLHARFVLLEQQKQDLTEKHRRERRILKEQHAKRTLAETKKRQERYSKGLRGFWDRLTGRHKSIRKENEADLRQKQARDAHEKDALIFKQLDQRRMLQARVKRLEDFDIKQKTALSQDIQQYQEIKSGQRDVFERVSSEKCSGPTLER